ncbi:uncharacterized protein PFL1_05704 [Pseudozyma flocculosa PF-1]|uniref:Uncharacterized protein n=2 Tax=Pseudozyma flocculosa TaxID=84751 RepID=A0A5C3F917_9BASI|nr:uncharacterized protein PFL1_05704 [Pseudozyma flocculosa PF-1]EPQ26725.1 hypothetical protein PFL1_05704 [Pseudozyma flocculosa PF-1]SPO40953.1 uncharacterized protein PSFLO_06435 [Pseudozyma flocculosa]
MSLFLRPPSASDLVPIAVVSSVYGLGAQLFSIFGSSDGLGATLLVRCLDSSHPLRRATTYDIGIEPLDHLWCIVTNFVKGFTETPLSAALFVLAYSAALQSWTYFGLYASLSQPGATSRWWIRGSGLTLLMILSQIVGFQGILMSFWIPIYALTPDVKPPSAGQGVVFESGTSRNVNLVALFCSILGTIIFLFNPEGGAYRRSQIFFQLYVLGYPLALLVGRISKPAKKPAGKRSATSSAFLALAWVSTLSWWLGLAACLFQPVDFAPSSQPIWNPGLTSYFTTSSYRLLSPADLAHSKLSAGEIFSILEVVSMSFAYYLIKRVDLIKSGRTEVDGPSYWRNLLLGGPGNAFARWIAFQTSLEGERKQL